MKIFVWILVGAFVLVCALTFLMGYVLINKVMKPKRKTLEHIREMNAPFEDAFVEYETVWARHPFELPVEGAVIRGEYITNPAHTPLTGASGTTAPRAKVAVICHGHTVRRASDFKYVRMFLKLGYHVVIFDERYFGESSGKYCTLGMNESRDITALVRYARSIFGENAFVAVHGESMGAASSLLSLQYESPALVVADCPFANSVMLFERLAKQSLGIFAKPAMQWGWLVAMARARYDFTKVNPMDAVRASRVPICFVHGLADTYIPCSHSEVMRPLSQNPMSELHLVPEAEHALSVYVDPPGYMKILEAFTKKVEDSVRAEI